MIYISNKEILQIFESNIYEYKSHAGINPINGHAHQERFLRSLAPKLDRISRQHGLALFTMRTYISLLSNACEGWKLCHPFYFGYCLTKVKGELPWNTFSVCNRWSISSLSQMHQPREPPPSPTPTPYLHQPKPTESQTQLRRKNNNFILTNKNE